MKKKLVPIVAIAIILLFLAFYLWVPGSVPQGQPPLAKLTSANIAPFTSTFDADANQPRVVLLLSPT